MKFCEKAFTLRKWFLSLRLVVARMKMCIVINGYQINQVLLGLKLEFTSVNMA